MSFIEELKRRKVIRVSLTYAVSAWVVLQVADLAVDSFGAPDWVMKLLFTLAALGFIVAVALAWAFQLTGQGVRRDDGRATAPSGGKWHWLGYGVLVLAVALLLFERFAAPPTAGEAGRAQPGASVAVLPFANMSASEENAYFADGLTDTLLHQLAQVPGLQVAARTSSFAFKGTNTDIREIARALNVENVLEGSVQRAGGTVRITAQLIQASDGYHLWSATFDRDLRDIFAVQDEISTQVALALRGSLLDESEVAVTRDGGTDDPEAYDLYLRALEAFRSELERETRDAETLLRRAVARDPEFALAWSLLARTLLQRGRLEGANFENIMSEVVRISDQAVSLAPNNPTVLAARAYVHLWRREPAKGLALLEKALAIEPNHAQALSWLSDIQFTLNRYDEALATAERAMAIDPLDYKLKGDSVSKFTQVGRLEEAEMLGLSVLEHGGEPMEGLSTLGNLYWRTGRLADALEMYLRVLELNPNYALSMVRIADAYIWVEDYDAARRWLGRMRSINPDRTDHEEGDLCRLAGDLDCALSVARAELDAAANEAERENALADLAYLEQDWGTMLENRLAQAERREESGNLGGVAFEQTWAALAADRLGDFETRDRLLDEILEGQTRWLANGSDSHYSYWFPAEAHALRGDAEQAAENLGKAIDRGYRDLPRVLKAGHYDKVLDTPAMRAVVDKLRAINAKERAAMHEVEAAAVTGAGE